MKTALGTTVGLLADITIGGLTGVVFIRFLKAGNDKNPILKGLGFGIGAWLLLFVSFVALGWSRRAR